MKKYSVKYYHLDTSMAGSFADEADYGIIEADSEDIAAWNAVDKEFPQGEYPECTREFFRANMLVEEIESMESLRKKKKPRHIVMAEKEAADPEYARRMDKAREVLAEEIKVCNQYARHEIMDRAGIVMNLLSNLLEDHPGMDEELNEHLVKSMGALYDLYQCAGNKFFDGEEE